MSNNNNLGGIPDLTRTPKKGGSVNKLFVYGGFFLGLLLVVVFGMVFVNTLDSQREREKAANAKESTKEIAEATQKKNFDADRKEIAKADLDQRTQAAAIRMENEAKAKADASNGRALPNDQQGAALRQFSGNAMLNMNSSKPVSSNKPSPAEQSNAGSTFQGGAGGARPAGQSGNIASAPFSSTSGSGGEKLNDRLSPTVLANSSAKLREDLTMLLRRGTMIPCVQQSAIVTNYPSMILCKTTKDTYSANGKVLLIERGSTVVGEQRTGLQRGQKSIFVIWSRIETDKGVSIDVDSPGTNAIGAAGIDAYVDNHWMERFSSAIFLTLIGDSLDAVKNYYSQRPGSNGSTQFYPAQTQTATQNMATEALKSSINIPPTGYSNQGSLLNIFVARDVDFRNVYALRPEN